MIQKRITEFFIVLQEMQSFADFLRSFADLSGILQKNADNFFSASVL